MNLNVPKQISLKQLRGIRFGDADAGSEDDKWFEQVFCQPDWMSTFLQGNHTILKGNRGTGKTGLFESLKREVISYDVRNEKLILVPIDQTLEYEEIRNRILPRIASKGRSASLRYRTIWEVFLVFEIATKILKFDDVPDHLRTVLVNTLSELGVSTEQPRSISKLFLNTKRKIGVKLTSTETGMPSADLYFDFSPADRPSTSTDPISLASSAINLPTIKAQIDSYLRATGRYVLVVADKLDDFTTGENLQTQRALLGGLLLCERDYRGLSHIELVLLFRTDLFNGLNLDAMGADKVHARSLELRWTPVDLRAFVARRIAYNLVQICGGDRVFVRYDPKVLYGSGEKESLWARKFRTLRNFWARITSKQIFDHGEVRVRNLSEEVLSKFIHAFFGDEVQHLDKNGTVASITIDRYLDTHFAFANGETTPRVMLMFCQLAVETAVDYFQKNPDLGDDITFPLIPRRSTCIAYGKLKKKLWEIHADFDKLWKHSVYALSKQAHRDKLDYETLRAACASESDSKVEEFISYLERNGVLCCENERLPLQERVYSLAILFRTGPDPKIS